MFNTKFSVEVLGMARTYHTHLHYTRECRIRQQFQAFLRFVSEILFLKGGVSVKAKRNVVAKNAIPPEISVALQAPVAAVSGTAGLDSFTREEILNRAAAARIAAEVRDEDRAESDEL